MLRTSGIYRIFCKASERCYIGSSVNIYQRWLLHRSDLRKGRHHSFILQRAWDKHGEKAFEVSVLEVVPDRDDLMCRENVWLKVLAPDYNVAKEVGVTTRGLKMGPMSKERKQKIADAVRGFKHTVETCRKMSRTRTGMKMNLSPEERERRRGVLDYARRFRYTEGQRRAISEFMRHREQTEESRRKRSEALKGKPWSEARIEAEKTRKTNKNKGGVWSKARREAHERGKKS